MARLKLTEDERARLTGVIDDLRHIVGQLEDIRDGRILFRAINPELATNAAHLQHLSWGIGRLRQAIRDRRDGERAQARAQGRGKVHDAGGRDG